MTKTKFSVDIHKDGSNSEAIFKAIGSHNGGIVPLCIEDFISYAQFEMAKYPSAQKGFYIVRDDTEFNVIRVSEDGGKTFTITIEERIIHELDPLPSDEKQGEMQP